MGRRRKNAYNRLKSKIIANILANNRMTRKQLAIKANMDYTYLCKLLSDNPKSVPSEEIIGRISAALDVEPWQIADGLEPVPLAQEVENVLCESCKLTLVAPDEEIPHEAKLEQVIAFLQRNGFYVDCFYDMVQLFRDVDRRYWERHAILEILGGMKDRLLRKGKRG